jgi:hypothetical protein
VRIEDSETALLPWEYLGTSRPPYGLLPGPLTQNRNIAIERTIEPERRRFAPPDKALVDDVTLVGVPVDRVHADSHAALREDLHLLGAKVNAAVGKPSNPRDRGLTWSELNGIAENDLSPVLLIMARIRRVKEGEQAVRLRLAGDVWITPQDLCELLRYMGDDGQARFRVIVIESFASVPGDEANEATQEVAESIARLGVGNVVFLCHPAEFAGYETGAPGQIYTFAGHLLAALNQQFTVPHAFYTARQQMRTAKPERFEHRFGIPGLYMPDYLPEPPDRSPGAAPSARAVSLGDQHAGTPDATRKARPDQSGERAQDEFQGRSLTERREGGS